MVLTIGIVPVVYNMGVLKHFAPWDIFWSGSIEAFWTQIYKDFELFQVFMYNIFTLNSFKYFETFGAKNQTRRFIHNFLRDVSRGCSKPVYRYEYPNSVPKKNFQVTLFLMKYFGLIFFQSNTVKRLCVIVRWSYVTCVYKQKKRTIAFHI